MNSMNPKGLTLIENMIAMFIFSVALLAIASLQVRSMKINANVQQSLSHSVALADTMEEILALPFDDTLLRDPDDGYAPDNPDHGPFKLTTIGATIEWEVDDQFPVADAKRVSITVRYKGDSGSQKTITYDYIKIKGFV
jgi:prepilin-type N-terminal cleavage/methylation domain-containing protein